MKLPDSEHTSRPWRIHELAPDFRLEDVWALPTPGGPDDLRRLVDQTTGFDPMDNPSRIFRTLFAIRIKVGELFGEDPREPDPDAPTIRDRLPQDLRETRGPDFANVPFTSVYLLHDEWAAELAAGGLHGIMHLGWVEDGEGGYRGQMAVLVKPNGLFGKAYLAAIKPFRYLLVYPALMREIGRQWELGRESAAPASTEVDTNVAVR
jgi:hypothetical protein